jgi:hypothetical protein
VTRVGNKRFAASLEFEACGGADPVWVPGTVTLAELSKTAADFGISAEAVTDMGAGWLAYHSKPYVGRHGTGRFVLRVKVGG